MINSLDIACIQSVKHFGNLNNLHSDRHGIKQCLTLVTYYNIFQLTYQLFHSE